MATLTPRFSADRAVREYTESHYLPAAAAYCERAAGKGALGRKIVEWQRAIEQVWPKMRFGELRVETRDGQHFFEVELDLNGLDPATVCVELYADGAPPERHEMEHAGLHTFRARVPAARSSSDYTPRMIPRYPGVAIPLESPLTLWQH
jgi:starch phosphorylase